MFLEKCCDTVGTLPAAVVDSFQVAKDRRQ